jgi:hypothetical protein
MVKSGSGYLLSQFSSLFELHHDAFLDGVLLMRENGMD